MYSVGLVVRSDKPTASITSWKDLWRPDLKGHLMLANITGNQGLATLFVLAIPKGSKNADLAHQLIDFWLSREVQTALANDLVDSPINRNARPKPEAADALTYGKTQIDSLVFMKPEMVVRERAGWVTQWNRMIATK